MKDLKRSIRRHYRFYKGLRRLKEDRNQHGRDLSCLCFSEEAGHGRGKLFARFADYPKICSCAGCCNPRHSAFGSRKDRLTLQEQIFEGPEERQPICLS